MINENRIVPVTATDLITLYGTIMKLAGTTVTAVNATTDDGRFASAVSGNMLASEPVKGFNITSGSSCVIYFVPAYDYDGFAIDGTAVTPAEGSAEVVPDGRTLYTATLSSGAITIAKAGF